MHPRRQEEFRAKTERDSMPGVTTPTFRCASCGEFKRAAGRKKSKCRPGYDCSDCCK